MSAQDDQTHLHLVICRPPIVVPGPVIAGSRECTCLGTCKGADGLAAGWVCALDRDNESKGAT